MIAAVISLSAVIAILTIVHYRERKDLYDRIMCRDIKEYNYTHDTPHKPVSRHEQVLKRWRDKNGGDKK